MATTRVFRSGNSMAVRLPRGFDLVGPDVEIEKRGDEIILREIKPKSMLDALALFRELPDDMGDREDTPPQAREGL